MGDTVLLRAAAGPRLGFGHLVRMVSLARALQTPPTLALRGGRSARRAARRLGCSLVDSPPQVALRRRAPDVLVVDDPCAKAAHDWVRAAQRCGVPVAVIRDRGLGGHGGDLVIDGSLDTGSGPAGPRQLVGPRYMILDPGFSRWRAARSGLVEPRRVAITLGGGVHAGYAQAVATRLAREIGSDRIDVLPGFLGKGRRDGSALRTGPAQAQRLGRAEVALVAGGIGLYEVSCLGIPAVAVAVTREQRQTVRAFKALGAVIDGGCLEGTRAATNARLVGRLTTCVLRLLDDPALRRRTATRARRVVDGQGGQRVAAALRQLAEWRPRAKGAV